jgi:hypothetical protein
MNLKSKIAPNLSVSAPMRVPLPAARMTAFIATTDEHG